MKKLVISLLRRADRKAEFQKNNLQNFEYIYKPLMVNQTSLGIYNLDLTG